MMGRLLVERSCFAFFDDWENKSQCGQDKWSDDIERSRCDITLYIHTHDTADGGDNEAPNTCGQGNALILNKTIFRMETVCCLAKRNVSGKYPEITQRHGDRVELVKLCEYSCCTGNEGLYKNNAAGQDYNHPNTMHHTCSF